MLHKQLFPAAVLYLFILQIVSCTVLDGLIKRAKDCESKCDQNITTSAPDVKQPCAEGCRLFLVFGVRKNFQDANRTITLCENACTEGFANESQANACKYGCNSQSHKEWKEEEAQTLHVLTPWMYVKSAYSSLTHHVRQFITTSWTVYVQEDSGKMVVLQTSPKVVESVEYSVSSDNDNSMKDYQQDWQEAKLDWMDCISHQSGIPRWLLVVVLFGFIFALLWLCCATAVTAPNHYLSPSKKKDTGYILVCEPNNEIKVPIVPPLIDVNEEAPPLPPKVSLI